MNTWKTFKKVLVFCVLIVASCTDKNTLTLVKDGATNYEIVFLGTANKSQYKSIEILQNYIQKASEVKLGIVHESSQSTKKHKIYVGNINNFINKTQINEV